VNPTVQCSCGKTLEITEELQGKRARCPSCSAIVDIPENLKDIPTLSEAPAPKTPYAAEDLYEKVIESVVGITRQSGFGSGVFVNDQGLIATNKHIVGTGDKAIVRLADSSEKQGDVVRSFSDYDLAFIKVDVSGNKFAKLREQPSLKVGQKVFAIGHPLGLQNTLTQGVISSISRLIRGTHYIQTDAPINPGNSGGPLLNDFAEVVGINTFMFRDFQGLGFAVPTEVVLDKFQEVIDDVPKLSNHAYCGVCGHVSSDQKYCLHCGAEIKPSMFAKSSEAQAEPGNDAERASTCPTCKTELEPSDTYCSKCGATL